MANILYIITSLSVGGAQKALLNLATSGFSDAYKPIVVSLVEVDGIQQQFEQAGIPVHVLGLNRLMKLPLLPFRLFALVRRIRPRVIHGWMHHGNLFATLGWLFAGCRPVLLWGMHHTPEKATLERPQHALVLKLGRWLSRFPRRIVYVSRRSMQRHTELGYEPRNARVIANGIPLSRSGQADESRNAVRKELGIPDNALLVGSLTRYVPEKDIPNMLAAIGLLQQQMPNVHFLLAGEGMEDSNPALRALLAALPDRENVHLLGVRTDASHLTAALDVATLSSRREAFPLFLAEAMAAGVPCVATDVGDIAEFVADTGLIVPAGKADALAQAWVAILQKSAQQRQQLGKRASNRVAERYSLDTVLEAYSDLLKAA